MNWTTILAIFGRILQGISPEARAALRATIATGREKAKQTANPLDDVFWMLLDTIIG